jgi:predicted transcriptional regulator of viral defense system
MKMFVSNDSKTMAKDTLYALLKKLTAEGKIERLEKGVYKLKRENEDEKGEGELLGL